MILRMDKLLIDLPEPKAPSPNSAAAVQELMRGRFGEMSTLMNYTFQSFNFRGRDKMRPFYDLVANIATEEYGHIELVAYTINLLLSGSTKRGSDPSDTPLKSSVDARNAYHFIASGQTALPIDSMGAPWNGSYVFSSGNLKLDLLHNFFLECGARANKIRVYEMVDDPVAREMVGYLLVRGGVHIVAYAKALQKLTGVDVGKLLPIPDISNKQFPGLASMRRKACTASCTAIVQTITRRSSRSGTGLIQKMDQNYRSKMARQKALRHPISRKSPSSQHRSGLTLIKNSFKMWQRSFSAETLCRHLG